MNQETDSLAGHHPFKPHCKPIRRLNNWLNSLLLVFAASLLLPGLAFADQAHYFVLKEAADGSIGVDFHQFVEVDGTLESNPASSPQSNSDRRLRATLSNKISGNVVFNTVAFGSPWLRGEFHGKGEIDGRALPVNDSFYVVRVPVQKGTTLRATVDSDRTATSPSVGSTTPALSGTVLEIDLDNYSSPISRTLTPALPAGYVSGSVSQNGPPSNRLDLLIVAEGYTASQQGQFVTQVTTLANTMLSIAPYSSFSQLINVSWLFVPSNQSGADKPSCPETPGSAVVSVDTAFDGTYCTSNIRRLVTVNTSKVLAAAANVPDWDKILVLVNDGEYGGSGGTLGVATTHALSAEIMQHEFGHMFSRLADEYETAYPGFPACNDLLTTSPCEANVTNQSLRANVKWAAWIDLTTSVPTIGPLTDPTASGLWQGARYQTAGMYRQCFNGIMRSLGRPFCHVDSEAFVKRLYGGWGGAPAQGVSLIEPDTVPASSAVSAAIQTDLTFQGTLAGSRATGGLAYTWLVNGISQKTGVSAHGMQQSFTYRVANAGPNTIELRVSDSTPFMLTAPLRSRLWTVQGTANTGSFGLSISRVGSGTITSNPTGISCGSTCSASFTGGSSVTLTATASSGYSFTSWGGACSGSSSTCTVSMTEAKSVSASFTASSTTRQITVTKAGNGSVTSSPSGISCGASCSTSTASFSSSTSVTFTATPDTGNTFGSWSGACTGSGSCTVAAGTSAVSLGATFNTTSGSTITTLQNGVSVTGLSGAAGSSTLFSIAVPSGASDLAITTSGGTGNVDIYIRDAQVPTTSTYDCRSAATGNVESCVNSAPSANTYYVSLYGYSAYSGVTVRASYTSSGGGSGSITGTSGNDTLYNGDGNNTVDGLAGLDTYVSTGPRHWFGLTFGAGSVTLTDGILVDGSDLLINIERLRFSNGVQALDVGKGQVGGMAYRIYKAAFNRTPDNVGLKYWMANMDGGMSLTSVAGGFIASLEFFALYGDNLTNGDFVNRLYLNVLGRTADTTGYDYWVGELKRGLSRSQVLASFSESDENINNVSATIANGVWLPD